MKQTHKSEFGYSKPSPHFLMKLKMTRRDMSWFNWSDLKHKTITDEEYQKNKKV